MFYKALALCKRLTGTMEPGPVRSVRVFGIEVRADLPMRYAAVGQCDIHLCGYSDALYAEAAIHVSLFVGRDFHFLSAAVHCDAAYSVGACKGIVVRLFCTDACLTVHQNEVCCR